MTHPKLLLLLLSCLLTFGCGEKAGDEPDLLETGIRGESCQSWIDCGEGLACIDSVCVIDVFPVSSTANLCQYQECTIPEQCCNLSAFGCDDFLTACAQGNGGACTSYRENCTCSVTTQRCEEGTCVFRCTSAQDCCPSLNINFCFDLQQQCELGDAGACQNYISVGCDCDPSEYACSAEGACQPTCAADEDCPVGVCQNNQCVACRENSDCPVGEQCLGFNCISTCGNTTNCPAFHICDIVTGACTPTGCFTDRECIAYTGNVLAYCAASKCNLPCESDLDCDDPFDFGYMACVEGICTFIGCETDEECKILNAPDGAPGTGTWTCVGAGVGVPF